MRQVIKHGAEIDAATPAEVARIIAAAKDQVADSSYRREKGAIQLDSTGAGIVTIRATRMYDSICQRVTLTAGAAGQVEFFENQQAAGDLLENVVLDANGRYSDAFSNDLFIPAGSQLLVVFIAAGANLQATVNLQIKQIRVVA